MALIAALISSVLFGVADFTGGYVSRRVPVRVVVVFSQVAGLATVLAAAALLGADEVTIHDTAWGVAAGLAGMVALVTFYHGLAHGRVSVVSPLAGIMGAAVPVVFGLVIGERPSVIATMGVLVALPAIYLIGTTSTDAHLSVLWRGGTLHGLAAGAGFGGFFVLISRTAETSGLWPLVSARSASVFVLGLMLAVTRELRPPNRSDSWLVISAGVMDILANVAFVVAARSTLLVLASVVTSLYPASTLLLARLVLHERTTSVQRLGLVMAAVAVVAITVA